MAPNRPKNNNRGVLSLVSQLTQPRDIVGDVLDKDVKRKATFRTIRNVLIIVVIVAILIAGILGYFGILPIYADHGLLHIKGGDGAFSAAVFAIVGALLFVIFPLCGLIGMYEMLRYVLLGVGETLDVSVPESAARLLKSPVIRIIGRLVMRWGVPFLCGVAMSQIASAVVSQVVGLGADLVINVFWGRKRPYIAYLLAVIDAGVAGYDGDLSPIRNLISAIKPSWTSGTLGIVFAALIFALGTGLWSVFSTKKQ